MQSSTKSSKPKFILCSKMKTGRFLILIPPDAHASRYLPSHLLSTLQPGPRRAGGFQTYTLQPDRYFAWINWSASGQFGHFMFAESHSSFIFLPRRNTRLLSSTISLNGPDTSKFELAAGPPLRARMKSMYGSVPRA